MSQAEDDPGQLNTRDQAEAFDRPDADELRARAMRIRERSKELISELGADHPLVTQALERAEALEQQAAAPGRIHLR